MTGFIPVLTFHSLDDGRAPTSFGPALFARGMETLALGGYRTISLAGAASLAASKRPFPEKSFVITFDDGYRNIYEKAFPVLAEYSFTATVFLTTGGGGRTGDGDRLPELFGGEMLSWGEIRIMNDAGIDFGAHTLTHPDLTRLSPEDAAREMTSSRSVIENALGAPVAAFAYPYGKYDARSLEIAAEEFSCACSDELGLFTASSDLRAIPRVDAFYLRGERLFALVGSPNLPLYILLRGIPRTLRRRLAGI
ncbi:MAG TPA: polysaccharide deacetylase family protein [Thermodesulfobacteriota bacterium]|nr:polysaccharide deacetylase family protein [Thermodesulfobacteriota bacterium]